MTTDDPLSAARGIVNGLFLALLFWAGVAVGFVIGRVM